MELPSGSLVYPSVATKLKVRYPPAISPLVHNMPSLSAANAAFVLGEMGTSVARAMQNNANTNTIGERFEVSFMSMVLRSVPKLECCTHLLSLLREPSSSACCLSFFPSWQLEH